MATKKSPTSKKRPINVPLRKGALEGYHMSDKAYTRRKHLLDLIKQNHATYSEVIKRLNVLSIYNKNRAPELSTILRRDINYLQRRLSPQKPMSMRRKSRSRSRSVGRKSRARSQSVRRKSRARSRSVGRKSRARSRSVRRKSRARSQSVGRKSRARSRSLKKTLSGGAKRKSKTMRRKKDISCERKKIAQVMGEFKRKSLMTPNKKVVKNRKQAIAIALNVARKSCEKKKK
jgi:hypothetical protein